MKRLILKLCLLSVLAGVYAYAVEKPAICVPAHCKLGTIPCGCSQCCVL